MKIDHYGNNIIWRCRCGQPMIISGGRFGHNSAYYQRPCPVCDTQAPSYSQLKEKRDGWIPPRDGRT